MDNERFASRPESSNIDHGHFLGKWTRIYLHGCLACAVVAGLTYAVARLMPLLDFVDSSALALLLAVVAILVLPPLVGVIVVYGLLPLLGKKEAWRGLQAWDDRLLSELSRAKQRTRIVIVNWPSAEVRTMGVLSAMLDSDQNGRPMAAVFVPTAPQTKFGYIRVVAVDDLEFTDWTLKEWQMYQLTFGSVLPPRLSGGAQ